MDPAQARSIGARIEATGRAFVDAPTSGGPARAAEGALTLLASGREDAMKRAEPIFDAIASKVYRLGAEAGAGSAFKMINQLLAGIHIAAACEAIALAEKLGLDLSKVYEVITASPWKFLDVREPRAAHPRQRLFAEERLRYLHQGSRHRVDMARAASLSDAACGLPALLEEMFLATAASGMGRDDDASVVRLYAKIAGVELNAPARTPAISRRARQSAP